MEDSPLLSKTRTNSHSLYRTISRISEHEPLPPDDEDIELAKTKTSSSGPHTNVYATISVLLVGVFISQTDQSLVLATYGNVASSFGSFDSGSWLMTAYILAQ